MCAQYNRGFADREVSCEHGMTDWTINCRSRVVHQCDSPRCQPSQIDPRPVPHWMCLRCVPVQLGQCCAAQSSATLEHSLTMSRRNQRQIQCELARNQIQDNRHFADRKSTLFHTSSVPDPIVPCRLTLGAPRVSSSIKSMASSLVQQRDVRYVQFVTRFKQTQTRC